jgi:hypothetical protein
MERRGLNRAWTAAEDALLGKLSEPEIAPRLHTTRVTVLKRRKKLGIAPCKVRKAKRMLKGWTVSPGETW